jgi:CHAD domain-containing protein
MKAKPGGDRMAYRIRARDDDVQAAVRRIACEQLDRALGEIDDPELALDETVHQLRKRCKKLRGLLRLVRPALKGYGKENKDFRDTARRLSPLRDADALIEAYDALMARLEGTADRRAFGPVRARLTREARAARQDGGTDAALGAVRAALVAARSRAAGWTLGADGADAVAGGLGKTYRRARKAMQAAWASPADEAMHDWRKRLKYHWYHLRLLEEVNPEMMRPRAEAADALGELLGDHHDLAVLEARIDATPEAFRGADLEAFHALLRGRKAALEEAAFAQGRVLLAERPKALVKRVRGYWAAWAKGKSAPERLLEAG